MQENKTEKQKININIIAVFLAFVMGLTFGKVDFDALLKTYVESKETSAVSRESTTEKAESTTAVTKKKAVKTTTEKQTQKQTETSKKADSEQATESATTAEPYTNEPTSAYVTAQVQLQTDAADEDETTLLQSADSYINEEESTASQTKTTEA